MKNDFVFVPGWLTGCFQCAKHGIFYDYTKFGAVFFCSLGQNNYFENIDLKSAFAKIAKKIIFATANSRYQAMRLRRPLRISEYYNTIKSLKINPS